MKLTFATINTLKGQDSLGEVKKEFHIIAAVASSVGFFS